MRKIVIIVLILIIIFGLGYMIYRIYDIQKQEYAIYNVIIDDFLHFFGRNYPKKIISIEEYTTLESLTFSFFGTKQNIDELKYHFANKVHSETIKNYIKRNKKSLRLNLKLFTRDILLLNKEKTNLYVDKWESPQSTMDYPLLTLSRVGFNWRMNEAVVYLESTPGWQCYYILVREKGRWVIKDNVGLTEPGSSVRKR